MRRPDLLKTKPREVRLRMGKGAKPRPAWLLAVIDAGRSCRLRRMGPDGKPYGPVITLPMELVDL